jgi:hypothetical protein
MFEHLFHTGGKFSCTMLLCDTCCSTRLHILVLIPVLAAAAAAAEYDVVAARTGNLLLFGSLTT